MLSHFFLGLLRHLEPGSPFLLRTRARGSLGNPVRKPTADDGIMLVMDLPARVTGHRERIGAQGRGHVRVESLARDLVDGVGREGAVLGRGARGERLGVIDGMFFGAYLALDSVTEGLGFGVVRGGNTVVEFALVGDRIGIG